MRNRAKCKLCGSIIESLVKGEVVTCECKEIGIDGGQDEYIVYYKTVDNFLRIDDSDNVITVTEKQWKPSKKDLIQMLDEMIKKTEELPQMAMMTGVTHYDLLSFMLLVSALFKED